MDECKPLVDGGDQWDVDEILRLQYGDDVDRRGEAVQVDPFKPKLKPPGTKRLKLKYDELPSNFAFKFNLRRYSEGSKTIPCNAVGDFSIAGHATMKGLSLGRGVHSSTFQLNLSHF